MNILPLIFAFLMIFSCIASTFLKELKSFFLTETTMKSFYDTERKLNNTIMSKAYRKKKGKSIHKKDSSRTTKPKNTTYFSRRSFFPPFENSKFNIMPLIQFEGDFKQHPLYESLAELLRLLYKKNLFDQHPHAGKIEYRLLEAILSKARKNPEVKELTELFPDDLVLRSLYYQMFKGTNQYSQKKGIPPLQDFIALHKGIPSIHFSFASPTLLEALFDHEMGEQILQLEKKRWEESKKYYFASKEDLQLLLMKKPTLSARYSVLDTYFDYSKQFQPRTEMGGIDQSTGLTMKKYLSPS